MIDFCFIDFCVLRYKHLFTVASFLPPVAHTFLSSRPISAPDDIFIILQGSKNDNVIERPMFMPGVTFLGFSLVFCLYCYKAKQSSRYFLPLMAVVCPSETPSVLSGINRIFTVASMIFRSSTRLGWAIYIRSICSLSYGVVLYFPYTCA